MIETAIDYAAPLKREMRRLGAQGENLHAMLDSIEAQLPASLVKNLRFVIAIRNKVFHGAAPKDVTQAQYTAACQRALDGLRQLTTAGRPAVSTRPLAAPAIRLGLALITAVLAVAAYFLVDNFVPVTSLESWGAPALALVVLTLLAQTTRVRHRLLAEVGARPTSWALLWLGAGVVSVLAAAYLFPPPPEALPVVTAAATLSVLVHLVVGIDPSRESSRVAH
mgnify:CR=1 FL=1